LEYIDLAAREELLFKDEVAAVQQLRSLRNQAAQSVETGITITDARPSVSGHCEQLD